jgi:hypothetical protein
MPERFHATELAMLQWEHMVTRAPARSAFLVNWYELTDGARQELINHAQYALDTLKSMGVLG